MFGGAASREIKDWGPHPVSEETQSRSLCKYVIRYQQYFTESLHRHQTLTEDWNSLGDCLPSVLSVACSWRGAQRWGSSRFTRASRTCGLSWSRTSRPSWTLWSWTSKGPEPNWTRFLGIGSNIRTRSARASAAPREHWAAAVHQRRMERSDSRVAQYHNITTVTQVFQCLFKQCLCLCLFSRVKLRIWGKTPPDKKFSIQFPTQLSDSPLSLISPPVLRSQTPLKRKSDWMKRDLRGFLKCYPPFPKAWKPSCRGRLYC